MDLGSCSILPIDFIGQNVFKLFRADLILRWIYFKIPQIFNIIFKNFQDY